MNRAALLADGWTEVAQPNPGPLALLVPGIVVLGGLATISVLYWQSIRSEGDAAWAETTAPSAGVKAVPGIPGVFMKSGVHFTEPMLAFLPNLRERLDFNITVTSGLRTPEEQADAMVYNWQAHGGTSGGLEYLTGLYGREGPRFHPLMPNRAAVAAEVSRVFNEGKWRQGHLGGKGLDFRVSDLSSEQRAALKAAGTALGVYVLDEGDHIHMDRLDGMLAEAAEGARKMLPVAIAASAGLGVIALVAVLAWTRRQARLVA